MRRFLIAWAFLAAAILWALSGIPERTRATLLQSPTVLSGTCSQATTFLARATGMDSTHNTAFTTMICGLVTDGVITGTMAGSATAGATACGSLLDTLYINATDTNTHALLNLCSTSFTATQNAQSFTADQGFSSASNLIDSNYTAGTAGGNYVQNGASLGNWSFTSAQAGAQTMGGSDVAGLGSGIVDRFTDDRMLCGMNDPNNGEGVANTAGGTTNGTGFFVCNRSSSSAMQMYRNGVAVTIAGSIPASTGVPVSHSFGINGFQNAGSVIASARQVAAAFIGGNLSSGNVTSLYNRVCAYLHTVNPTAVPSC